MLLRVLVVLIRVRVQLVVTDNTGIMEVFSLVDKNSASKMTMVSLSENLTCVLNTILADINIDKVIIENQIGPHAIRMKCLQCMLIQYFVTNNILPISIVSPCVKLNLKNSSYAARKKQAINDTLQILYDLQMHLWIDKINSSLKKDDLCDAFLQMYRYFQQNVLKSFFVPAFLHLA